MKQFPIIFKKKTERSLPCGKQGSIQVGVVG